MHRYTVNVGTGAYARVQSDPYGSTRLGKFQLIRKLATGGMAELFLARSTAMHGFEKIVVLKRILPQHAESEDFIRMFLTEARLAATLHHPNIVQVYDIGDDRGAHFFTMEYVQGQDLRKIVRAARKAQRPIPLEHILHVVMGVAAGLHHAHTMVGLDGKPLGIVHRDVSPSNVLVTYEGSVKIVDFGIAKAATAQVATIAGTLKGKIPYMSPEQCRGEIVDCRSDIFSIGTLLWELTTGKRLFTGENEFAILNRVAKGDVPLPSSVRPEYPPELEAIVMRALQADPDQRYSRAIDLQIDLEDFAREARLPVSSARMSKFMRELFEEDIAQVQQELAEPTVIVGESEAGDLTPSELRPGSASTRSPSDDSSGGEPGTDLIEPRSRRRRQWAPWLAAAGGFVTTLGVVAALSSHRQAEQPAKEPAAPVVVIDSAPVPPSEPAVVPAPPPTAVEPKPPAERESAILIEPPPAEEGPEPDSKSGEDDEQDPGSEAEEDERKPSKSRPSRKRSRRSVKASDTANKKKPKWDPKGMLPPGM